MPESRQFTQIGFRTMRFTRTDGCGRPIYGDRSRLVTEGVISLGLTAVTEDTDEVAVANGNGKVMARRPAKSRQVGWTGEVAFIGVDPEALEFTTGNPTVNNARGTLAGVDIDSAIDPDSYGFALEVWGDLSVDDACNDDGELEVGYTLIPFARAGHVGDVSYENDAVNFTVSDFATRRGHAWGTGPYLVDVDSDGDPAALALVRPSVSLRAIRVGLEAPELSGGAIPLDNPAAPAATGATAGTPGAFTPSGAFRPELVSDLGSVTAAPTSAWTAGQGVLLQSGDYAHWTGTAWAAGKA